MNVEDSTLDAAIQRYAMLLNRPAWSDPGRAELQREVWTEVINDVAKGAVGKVTLNDLRSAMTALIRSSKSPLDIMPSTIIEAAVKTARERAVEMRRTIDNDPEMLLYEATCKYRSRVMRGEPRDKCDIHLRIDADELAQQLSDSGHDPSEVAATIAGVYRHQDDEFMWADGQVVTAIPGPVDVDRVRMNDVFDNPPPHLRR